MGQLGKYGDLSPKSTPVAPAAPKAESHDRSSAQRQDVRDALRDLLLRNDPLNINYGGGVESYRPEIERITPRLSNCRCAEDVCAVIHEELCNSFGAGNVGERGCYRSMSLELWDVLLAGPPLGRDFDSE